MSSLHLFNKLSYCSKFTIFPFRCFLSEDTKPVAVIIENILQCALDFGLHLTGGHLYAGTNRPGPLNLQSDINLCKVIAYFSH